MERAIAVVEASDSAKALVEEAGELAAGVDAELLLVHVTTDDEYAERRESMMSVPSLDVNYTVDDALDGAEKFANDIGRDVLDDVDVDYEPVGRLGEKGDEILALAEERDVRKTTQSSSAPHQNAERSEDADHIFLAGRKRSPAGKAIFGDIAQRIILEFDGAVTVVTT